MEHHDVEERRRSVGGGGKHNTVIYILPSYPESLPFLPMSDGMSVKIYKTS